LLLATGISLGLMWWAGTAQAAPCGTGLAAEDLAGNCRLNPPTPGALEAVGQAPAPTPIPEPTPTPTPSPTPLTLDNGDPGTFPTGTWWVSTGSGFFGTDSLFSKIAGDTYRYTFDLTQSGSGDYEVWLWWTTRASRAINVPIDIKHAGGTTTVPVNQQQNGGQWNRLGTTWTFNNSATVTVRAVGNSLTANADAVKLVPVTTPPPPPPISTPTGWEIVPSGTYATRPLYNLTVFEKDGFLTSIGRVERGQICEAEELRKTTYSYHAVTNKAGMRGLAVCTQTSGAPTPTPTPAPSNQAIVTATWSADIFSTGGKGFDRPWDHCVGRQENNICRTVIVFPTAVLSKDKTIASLRMKVIVPYVTAGLEATTWRVGRYDGDPIDDADSMAYARAASPTAYIKGTSLLRTTGTKMLGLSKAVADLNAAVREGRLFIVAIKSNREGDVDRFTVIGRYNTPATAPQLIVGY
jgi:hypothetical protein